MSIRQKEILLLLNEHQTGLSIPKLELSLGISRTAVNQHLTNMERDGLITKGPVEKTGGRPGYVYLITERGIEQLPKQYSWFSELMLDALKVKLGPEGLTSFLQDIAVKVGRELQPRLDGKSKVQQVNEIQSILNELGYDASVIASGSEELPVISAQNCVYHKLATKHPEVCQFDLALLETLLENHKAVQTKCMVKGGATCEFCFDSSPHESRQ